MEACALFHLSKRDDFTEEIAPGILLIFLGNDEQDLNACGLAIL